ncbi:hypothetical protein [Pontixanthobacter aquaemixtae]|nr:hypothetical protein [Pontixanthobacter aquaemixtae]
MTIFSKIKPASARAISRWRALGQIAPLTLGFVAGLCVTLVL